MKIMLKCWDCMKADPSKTGEVLQIWTATMPLKANGTYDWVCPEGHVQSTALAHSHFEILAEVAVQALVDGYSREAVLSFTGATERLMQAYVETIWRTKGLDEKVRDLTWKAVSAQSERQVGLFLATWVLEEQTAKPLFSKETATFRNNVVHKGHIPTIDEAADYGQAALAWMLTVEEAGMDHEGWWDQYNSASGQSYKTKLALDFARQGMTVAEMIDARNAMKN